MSGRKVFVSSDMSVDERLLLVSERNGMAALPWPWLLTALDDWGRCEAAPLRLKARVWPMNDAVSVALISEALDLFAEVALIERYTVEGREYLAYLDHLMDQRRFAVRPSRHPDPPATDPHAKQVAAYIEACHAWRVKEGTPWLRHRSFVFQRDGYTCVYCGSVDRATLTLDHVIPRAQAGSDERDNLVTACWSCNRTKWARTPAQAGMVITRTRMGGKA